METKRKIRLAVCFHPGSTLAEKLNEMGMSAEEFAAHTQMPVAVINAVINESCSVSSEMAAAFECVTKIPAHFWLNKQRSYDEFISRKRREAQFTQCAIA